jgi:hypothetical protein
MFRKEGEIIMTSKKTQRNMQKINQNSSIRSGPKRHVSDLDKNSRTYRRLVKKGKIDELLAIPIKKI